MAQALAVRDMDERSVAIDELIVGSSPAIVHLREMVLRVAPSAASVLITGPSGSGKEATARALHAASPRASRPFVAVNCGAIPVELIESELFGHERGAFTGAVARRIGRFEEACGGTLFLDEIGDMRTDMQVKLLRVLEDGIVQRVGGGAPKRVDVRIVCATHRDLAREICDGRFREDLYFRLSVLPIRTPALADRPGDIHELIDYFQAGGQKGRVGFDAEGRQVLEAHDWPGNVRELRNFVERARILHGGEMLGGTAVGALLGRGTAGVRTPIAIDHRRGAATDRVPINLKDLLETMELERIQMALDMADGVVSEAARLLTLKRTTLIEKMRKYRVG